MSSKERKKKKTHSTHKFMNFVVKRINDESVGRRVVFFVSLLMFYIIIARLGLVDGWYCSPLFALSVIGLFGAINKVVQENLLIVEDLGLQIDVKYVVGSKSAFIPNDIIKDIFINEVISRHRVIYVLSVLTKDEYQKKTIVPLFQETLPRLECLQMIYRAIKSASCRECIN